MIISKKIAKTLHEVPEESVIEAFQFMKNSGVKGSGWEELLKLGKKFKRAGCSPIYLSNEDGSRWTVSSEETYQRQLH